MTKAELIQLLAIYPDHFVVTNEQNEPFVHMINGDNNIIISTKKPIGYCHRSGGYVYPSVVDGYSAFSPELDEDLTDLEWTPFKYYKVTDIKYDTDGEEVELPTEMVIRVDSDLSEGELLDYIANYISDKTGFTHLGFSTPKEVDPN